MSTKSSEAAPQTIEPVGCASLRTVRELEVRRLGIVPYAEALALQRALVEERRANRVPDLLILLQHPPVITVGVRGDGGRSHIIADTDRLAALGSAHRALEPNCCSSMATRPGLLLPSGSTSRYRSSVWM